MSRERWRVAYEELNETGTLWRAVARRGSETAIFEAQTLRAARRHRAEFMRREATEANASANRT